MSDYRPGNGAGNGEFHTIEPEPERVRDMEIDVMWHSQHITRLHLQEPTGRQVETAEKELIGGPNAYTLRRYQITLIAQVAKVDRQVVESMPVSQIEEAFDFLGGLLARGRQTGGN